MPVDVVSSNEREAEALYKAAAAFPARVDRLAPAVGRGTAAAGRGGAG